jgi:pimeloyl-ACP methyl ester carboxylesterase
MSPRVHCIAVHALGFGKSRSSRQEDYAPEVQAEWIRRFLDRAKVDRIHLMGHDLGAACALALAVRHPHRIGRLILSHCPPRADWIHPLVRRIDRWFGLPGGRSLLRRFTSLAGSRRLWGGVFQDPSIMKGKEWRNWNAPLLDVPLTEIRRLLRQSGRPLSPQTQEAMANYRRPTMLLWGCDAPFLSPSWAVQLYHDIPGAKRFELIPFAGHFPQWERPEPFVRAVLDFLLATTKKRRSSLPVTEKSGPPAS